MVVYFGCFGEGDLFQANRNLSLKWDNQDAKESFSFSCKQMVRNSVWHYICNVSHCAVAVQMGNVKSDGSFSSLKCCFKRLRQSYCWRMPLYPYLQWMNKQLLRTQNEPHHANQDGGSSLCSSWDPLIQSLEKIKQNMVLKNRIGLPSQGSTTLPASIWIRCTQLPHPRKKSYICNVTHHFHISHYLWGMKRTISYHSWCTLKYQFPLTWYKICYLLPFYASPWQQPLPPSYIAKPLSLKYLRQLITLQYFIT